MVFCIFLYFKSWILLIFYFIYTCNPIYKYKQKAINILKEYKQNNTTTIVELSQQINNLQDEFDKQYKDNKDLSYTTFSLKLSTLSSKLYTESANNNVLNNNEIDKYIKELQEYK